MQQIINKFFSIIFFLLILKQLFERKEYNQSLFDLEEWLKNQEEFQFLPPYEYLIQNQRDRDETPEYKKYIEADSFFDNVKHTPEQIEENFEDFEACEIIEGILWNYLLPLKIN